MLLAGTPALLLAPEGAAIGAVYLLIIALSEGGALVIKFTAKGVYDSLKGLFTGSSEKEDSDWVMVPHSPEPPAEMFVLPGGMEFAVALAEFTASAETQPAPANVTQSVMYEKR